MKQQFFNAIMCIGLLWVACGVYLPSDDRIVQDVPKIEEHLVPLPEGKWAESYLDTVDVRQTYNIFVLRNILRKHLEDSSVKSPVGPVWGDPNVAE